MNTQNESTQPSARKLFANPASSTTKLLPAESDVYQRRPVKLMMIVARLTKKDIAAARERLQCPRTAEEQAAYDVIQELGDAFEEQNART